MLLYRVRAGFYEVVCVVGMREDGKWLYGGGGWVVRYWVVWGWDLVGVELGVE